MPGVAKKNSSTARTLSVAHDWFTTRAAVKKKAVSTTIWIDSKIEL